MAALAITGFFAEGRVVLLSDIHRVFTWFERQDRRSGKARAIVCLECPLSNFRGAWSRPASGIARRRCQLNRAPAGLALGRVKLMTACGTQEARSCAGRGS